MKIFLLTHERELLRASNTGVLAERLVPEIVARVAWARNAPNAVVLDAISSENTALLYPSDDVESAPIEAFDNIIVLDATWQEARKMFNQSPYLKSLPRVQFHPPQISQYQLRRNQPEGGLCTAECVVEILKTKGCDDLAARLDDAFVLFNSNSK